MDWGQALRYTVVGVKVESVFGNLGWYSPCLICIHAT